MHLRSHSGSINLARWHMFFDLQTRHSMDSDVCTGFVHRYVDEKESPTLAAALLLKEAMDALRDPPNFQQGHSFMSKSLPSPAQMRTPVQQGHM